MLTKTQTPRGEKERGWFGGGGLQKRALRCLSAAVGCLSRSLRRIPPSHFRSRINPEPRGFQMSPRAGEVAFPASRSVV